MAPVIYHFLKDKGIRGSIRKAKEDDLYARDLAQVEVFYAPLHSPANHEEIAHAVVELFEGDELLLRMEFEELHLNPDEQELVARCETLGSDTDDDEEGIHIHVQGLLRANEFVLSPLAETVSNEKKYAIAYLLHEVIFNGYFYSLIVNEQKMKAMPESWQEVWKDFCFHRTLRFGEDTYWRANDPADPILA